MENKMADMKKDLVVEVRDAVLESMKGDGEKEKRKKNLVLFIIEESTKETLVDRKEEDMKFFKILVKEHVKVEDIMIQEVVRLGEKNENGRPRPLLCKLDTVSMKYEVPY